MAAPFTAFDWTMTGFAALVVVGGTLPVPSIWRGDTRLIDDLERWWPYSKRSWQGWTRAYRALAATTWMMLIALLALGVDGITDLKVLRVISSAAGLAALVMFGLALGVVVFNRPRVLVPPTRRGEARLLRRGTSQR